LSPITFVLFITINGDGYLAHGASDGSVGAVKIAQKLCVINGMHLLEPTYTIEIIMELEQIWSMVLKGICVSAPNKFLTEVYVLPLARHSRVCVYFLQPTLVSSNPGQIKLFSRSSERSTAY